MAEWVSTATLHEASGRTGALPAAIKPIAVGMQLRGPAVTVSCSPGNNLLIHHAIYVAEPGDVLVVEIGQGDEYGYWGEIMTVAAQARGLGGLVIDGSVRDSARLEELAFPVFSRGICIRGTGKEPGGSINDAIRLGDVDVTPGDLVVGDVDGVVVIGRDRVADVLTASTRREADEADQMQRLRGGERTIDIFNWPTNDLE
jgi:4-hydroxy-4-methyl-2-oxoglutarate aldolase